MATATELADTLVLAYVQDLSDKDGVTVRDELDAVKTELRRIPDLEQRIVDAVELIDGAIPLIPCGYGATLKTMREFVAAHSPQPIAWQDCGDGSIAEFGGWTLYAGPCVYTENGYFANAGRRDHGGWCHAYYTTIADAKAAAEAWVRKQVAK